MEEGGSERERGKTRAKERMNMNEQMRVGGKERT